MKASPFITTAKAVILVCFAVFVVLPLLVACVWAAQDWRYMRFCWRSQQYYARVAEACDIILAAGEPIPREIRRNKLESLPPALRELDVSRVIVETNLVMVVVGGGLLTHHIIWTPAADGTLWNLTTSSPETRKSRLIYSKTRPATANQASPVDGGDRLLRIIERSRPAATDSQRWALPPRVRSK
jgi:hypothetical protein